SNRGVGHATFTSMKVANGAKMEASSTNVKATVAARCRSNTSSHLTSRKKTCRMKREEFSVKTKDQAAQRAGGHCEKCGMPFGGRRPTYDHILPCAFGGKATL